MVKKLFFSFYKKDEDNKYYIQLYESKCREMKYLYDLNIIINTPEKNNFDLNYVKKIIFVPDFIHKTGTFILNSIDINELSKEFLIFITYNDIEYDIKNKGSIYLIIKIVFIVIK